MGEPQNAVIRDTEGNLRGTTYGGGSTACGCGTVFKLGNGLVFKK